MPKYNVEAEGTIMVGAGPSGEAGALFILALVTDADGAPVTGLKKSNFKVWATASMFGDLGVQVSQELDAEAPGLGLPAGLYQIKVNFSTGATGQFVFILKVTKPGGRASSGRALVPVVKLR